MWTRSGSGKNHSESAKLVTIVYIFLLTTSFNQLLNFMNQHQVPLFFKGFFQEKHLQSSAKFYIKLWTSQTQQQ